MHTRRTRTVYDLAPVQASGHPGRSVKRFGLRHHLNLAQAESEAKAWLVAEKRTGKFVLIEVEQLERPTLKTLFDAQEKAR